MLIRFPSLRRRFAALALGGALLSAPAVAQPILVSELGIIADAPFYIGVETGLFADAHLDVQLQHATSAADVTLPLSTNQVQVTGGGLSAGLFNAVARGWPIRIAMGRTRDVPGHSSDILVAATKLRPTLKTLADLKSRTIAINATYGALHYMVAQMLDQAGLLPSDVNLVTMPFPSMGAALASGAVDLAAVSEPFAAQFAARDLSFDFHHAADVLTNPPLEVSVVLFSKEWADHQTAQAQTFTEAYLKAVRIYIDAMNGGAQRPAVVKILMKYTNQPDPAFFDRFQWSFMDPNASLAVPSLILQEKWYRASGALTKDVDVDAMIDRRFLDAALDKIGRQDKP